MYLLFSFRLYSYGLTFSRLLFSRSLCSRKFRCSSFSARFCESRISSINIVNYNPLKGSSYIDLPQELRNSAKGLINMKNKDNECFRWCHIRHLNPQDKDPQRIKKTDKQYIEKLDYSSIEFPVTVKQINKIEKQNNICINLFGYEKKTKISNIYLQRKVSRSYGTIIDN